MIKGFNMYVSGEDIKKLLEENGLTWSELLNLGLYSLIKEGVKPDLKKELLNTIQNLKVQNRKSGLKKSVITKYNKRKEIIKYYLEQLKINKSKATLNTTAKYNITSRYLTDLKRSFRNEFNIPSNADMKSNIDAEIWNYYQKLIKDYYLEYNKKPKDVYLIVKIYKKFNISLSTFKKIKKEYKTQN